MRDVSQKVSIYCNALFLSVLVFKLWFGLGLRTRACQLACLNGHSQAHVTRLKRPAHSASEIQIGIEMFIQVGVSLLIFPRALKLALISFLAANLPPNSSPHSQPHWVWSSKMRSLQLSRAFSSILQALTIIFTRREEKNRYIYFLFLVSYKNECLFVVL